MMSQISKTQIIGLAALVLIAVSVFMLERDRAGLQISDLDAGTTPATLYQQPGAAGPVIVAAHGFAGSRQMMHGFSLRLAQAGYRVVAFDFEGHGANPKPMTGDVESIDGTTKLLVAETRRVIEAARALPDVSGVALLGHSMATDIIVRASIAEADAGKPVDAVIAVSMFSQAVTADQPERLLIMSGEWERRLRDVAMRAVHLVDANAGEGDLATAGSVQRQAIFAPWVEHVGVLFSPVAVNAAQGWLDNTFDRQSAGSAGYMGLWILALLAGIVMVFYPLASLLPKHRDAADIPVRRFLLAVAVPAILVPLAAAPLYRNFLPVLVADYLMIHLALYGLVQLVLLRGLGVWRSGFSVLAVSALGVWGIVVFGLALDRYAASFWPTAERLPIIAVLCVGTIPFMLADSCVTGAGRGALWRRAVARMALFVSLGIAAAIKPEQLTFVLIVLPVFALFFLVHGLMGRWAARRSGAVPAGLGLGICLAWALGVSFPLLAFS